jgi:hypothetical protein
MDSDNESINGLNDDMVSIYDRIKRECSEMVDFCYGAQDINTLVVIGKGNIDINKFRKSIGLIAAEEPNEPVGMVLGEAPDEYSGQTTAYIRYNPKNAYEYVIGICAELDVSDKRVRDIFKSMYDSVEDESDNPLEVATGYIYNYSIGKISISELSKVTGVSEDKIRERATDLI